MEMGDIDLNHLLKKRREEDSKKSVTSNENFLRITWQQMLEAVHTIHQNRIVHSDLKPANFLCVKGVLKLIDFGIAKPLQNGPEQGPKTRTGLVIGTVQYMAPEQLRSDQPVGPAADLYAVGILFFELVTGSPPYEGSQQKKTTKFPRSASLFHVGRLDIDT